jgi:general secretion pathway protein L
MLASFFSWWIPRTTERLTSTWTNAAARPRDGVVIDLTAGYAVSAPIRRKGILEAVGLGVATRMAGRRPVLLRPPEAFVLAKHHIVPTAPRRELDRLLRYQLARITPFPVEALFWRWDGHVKPADRTRTEITLTMVPKALLAPAIAALVGVGLKANFIEVGPPERPRMLPLADAAENGNGSVLAHGLAWTCGGLAIIAMVLPMVPQELGLRATDDAIAELQPTIRQVEALRRGLTPNGAAREALARETERTGDLLQVLATITRILPNDTHLTEFSLRKRLMTISGRTTATPRPITGLSADRAIHDPAFAAPVTRIKGATSDVFSIKAEITR